MKYFIKNSLLVAGLGLAVLFAVPVLAQKAPAASISTVISSAEKLIDMRVKNLENLITRISLMKKVSNAEQSALSTSVQNEIDQLTALRAKIDRETNRATLATDYKSITQSFRIYALVLPQTMVIAASDRALTIVDSMNTVGDKVKSRISNITGSNATTINQILSDFTAKVTDAGTQARAAAKEVISLTPDQGDKTKMAANTTALKDARSKLKTATADLVAARKDIGTVVKDVREIGSAPSSTQTPQ